MKKKGYLFGLLIMLMAGLSINQASSEKPVISPAALSDFEVAESLLQEGKYEEAMGKYKSILRREGTTPLAARALHRVGVSFFHQKNYDSALKAFQEVIDKFPLDNSEFREEIVMAHLELEQTKPRTYEVSNLSRSTLIVLSQIQRGQVYSVQGRYEEAIEEFQKAIDNYPHSPLVIFAFTEVAESHIRQGNLQEAINIFKNVARRAPSLRDKTQALMGLADCYLRQKEFDKALKEYRKISDIAIEPATRVCAEYFIGYSYKNLGQDDEALTQYQKVMDNFPDDPGGWTKRANKDKMKLELERKASRAKKKKSLKMTE